MNHFSLSSTLSSFCGGVVLANFLHPLLRLQRLGSARFPVDSFLESGGGEVCLFEAGPGGGAGVAGGKEWNLEVPFPFRNRERAGGTLDFFFLSPFRVGFWDLIDCPFSAPFFAVEITDYP